MQSFKAFFALVAAWHGLCAGRDGADPVRRARRRRRAESQAAMAGAVARSGHRGARGAVSPARRRAVSAGADRACLDPERAASRANAAAGIPRAGGVAGGARLCRAGAGTPGPWRHRRPISRGPGRLRRRQLFPRRAMRPRTRSRRRSTFCAGNPSSGRTARSSSGIPPAAWGALALAGEDPNGVAAIIAFAPGRGGHANDLPNQVCAPHTLIASAAEFGEDARVPVIWLVAANDSYFSPDLSRQLADAFRARRRQGGFPRAAGLRQRGPLAGRDRRRRDRSSAPRWRAR